ncbi:hypothetical protein J2W98_000464 [Paenibacillus peoriae]|uniref:Uncharacterized protein n=1 Tax=Paenibacillus peoriae TaxID=59893 RepID=A0ABU1Q9W3_9BACL|nr:hypothetical protein [Paenibacillus peoriae]SFR05344.1 hypothetical protein SAMN04488603_10215 [Paenibacillus sp. cl130]
MSDKHSEVIHLKRYIERFYVDEVGSNHQYNTLTQERWKDDRYECVADIGY